MKKTIVGGFVMLSLACTVSAQNNKILFDATKAETAGNADWVIDADVHDLGHGTGPAIVGGGNESDPQNQPTPAQSTVTSTTLETYWEGALSAWGIDCVKYGYEVETLPVFDSITYGNKTHPYDLSNYHMFVIDEPNIKFTTKEKTALMNFVKNGGSLFMISDHCVSDRNNDGWDSPMIWRDFLKNNPVQNNPFGIIFDSANFSQTTTNVSPVKSDSILTGPYGTGTEMMWSNGTSMTLYPHINKTAMADVFMTGAKNTDSVSVMFAHAHYGKGKVAAEGDSSPPDDGTGDPNDALYNGWTADASGNHQIIIMNATIWLMEGGTVTSVDNTSVTPTKFEIYPNPMFGTGRIKYVLDEAGQVSINMYDVTGKMVKNIFSGEAAQGLQIIDFNSSDMPSGVYFCRLESDHLTQTQKVIITK
jgi:type IX secretion system substrate protein